MEKHFITALLVLILLAPQTGLEAKSRHHGVKDRDHNAEERDDDDKKRYHKSKNRYHKAKKRDHDAKKRHHKSKKRHNSARKFFRFAHATKAELELLNQAISDTNLRIDGLGQPATELPADLAMTLTLDQLRTDVDANRTDIGTNGMDIDTNEINISINKSGVDFNTPQITQNHIAIGEIRAVILELSKLIEELHPQPPPGATFSGEFIEGQAPGTVGQIGTIGTAWSKFTSQSIGMFNSFSSIKISSSIDDGATATCTNEASVNLLANALRSSTEISLDCNGRTWSVSECGGNLGFELRAGLIDTSGATACICSPDAVVIRPLAPSRFWGGAGLTTGAATCGEPSQTLEVILTPQ